jgi:hypothetical protein
MHNYLYFIGNFYANFNSHSSSDIMWIKLHAVFRRFVLVNVLLEQQYIVHCIAVRKCDVPVDSKTFGCGIHMPEKQRVLFSDKINPFLL